MEITTLKITNPLYVGALADRIKAFADKVDVPTITYENLYAYFCRTVQFGGDAAEFWVAYEDNSPVAFAHWYVQSLPHVGATNMDYIYSWSAPKVASIKLVQEWEKFGQRHRAPYYYGDAINKAVFKRFVNIASEMGYTFDDAGITKFVARKKGE